VEKEKMTKPLIYVVGTDGIIASRYDARLGGGVSAASAQELVSAVYELGDIADIRVVEHSNINTAPSGGPHTGKAHVGTYMSRMKRRAISSGLLERHQSSQPAHGGIGAYRDNPYRMREIFAKAGG
jgi:hypothetical protein